VEREDVAAIRHFVEQGGDLEMGATLRGETLLYRAAKLGKMKSYKCLLELGASPNTLCRGGALTIQYVAAKKDPEWLRLALRHDGDPNLMNSKGRGHAKSPPLFWAVYFGCFENVTALVEAGADMHSRNEYGSIILADAASHMKFRVVQYLLDRGVDYERAGTNGASLLVHMKHHKATFYGANALAEYDAYCYVREWLSERGVPESEMSPIDQVVVNPTFTGFDELDTGITN
jgi:hypothetical protein